MPGMGRRESSERRWEGREGEKGEGRGGDSSLVIFENWRLCRSESPGDATRLRRRCSTVDVVTERHRGTGLHVEHLGTDCLRHHQRRYGLSRQCDGVWGLDVSRRRGTDKCALQGGL